MSKFDSHDIKMILNYYDGDLIHILQRFQKLERIYEAVKNLPASLKVTQEMVIVPCPDNLPGCAVAHYKPKDILSELGKAIASLEKDYE